MPQKNERSLAVSILTEILETNAYANIALRKALAESNNLDSVKKSFVTDLVNETLRNLILIDYTINKFSTKTPIEKMKPFIRNLLRISVCQINHMERIPSHAAINEAVNLTKNRNMANLSGFANGVLRSVDRAEPEEIRDTALKYSYPKWLYSGLTRWLGQEDAESFCENSHKPPPVIIFTNTVKITQNELAKKIMTEGVIATPLDEYFLILKNSGDISSLPSFKEGLFFVIDPGAMLAVNALGLKSGLTMLDICAAPGGKSFAAACIMGNQGIIRSYDIHQHRLQLISQTRKRLGLSIISPKLQDALLFDPSLENSADAVLLDAPCSGLGTIRKHPEMKYTRTMEDITAIAAKQLQMLENTAKYVKPKGTLVYCTCTITHEENINNINSFIISNKNFKLEKTLQTLPTPTSDGFFIARMLKQK